MRTRCEEEDCTEVAPTINWSELNGEMFGSRDCIQVGRNFSSLQEEKEMKIAEELLTEEDD